MSSFENSFQKNIQLGPESEAPYTPPSNETAKNPESRESMVSPEKAREIFINQLQGVVEQAARLGKTQKWEGQSEQSITESIYLSRVNNMDKLKAKAWKIETSIPDVNMIAAREKTLTEVGDATMEKPLSSEYADALMRAYLIHAINELYAKLLVEQEARKAVGEENVDQVFPPAFKLRPLIEASIRERSATGAADGIAKDEIESLIAFRVKEAMENPGKIPSEQDVTAFAETKIAKAAAELGIQLGDRKLSVAKGDKNGPTKLRWTGPVEGTESGYFEIEYNRERAGFKPGDASAETSLYFMYYESEEDDRLMDIPLGYFDLTEGKWEKEFLLKPEKVIEALDEGGIEDPKAKELAVQYTIQCEEISEKIIEEDKKGENNYETQSIARFECNLAVTSMYAATNRYKAVALESLEQMGNGVNKNILEKYENELGALIRSLRVEVRGDSLSSGTPIEFSTEELQQISDFEQYLKFLNQEADSESDEVY